MNPVRNIGLDYNSVFEEGFDIDSVNFAAIHPDFDRSVQKAGMTDTTGVLYGASTSGQVALRLIKAHPDITIREAVDLAPAKMEFCGLPVARPRNASWGQFVLITVSPSNYLSVMQTLAGLVPEDVPLCFLWKNELFDPAQFELLRDTDRGAQQGLVPMSGDPGELEKIFQDRGTDSRGQIFFRGVHTYRLILKQDLPFYRALMGDAGRMKALHDAGMVKTWRSDFGFPDYPLVLEHRSLVPQRPANWSNRMFRDAALFFLEFWRFLTKEGLSLQDSHSHNVMFENTNPRFVDFTSIGPREATTLSPPFLKELFEYWVHPLAFLKSHQPVLLRELLRTGTTRIPFSTVGKACRVDICQEIRKLHQDAKSCFKLKALDDFFEIMISWIVSVTPVHAELGWNRGGYQNDLKKAQKQEGVKEKAVDDLFARFSPALVIDLGCNLGRFSVLAAHRKAQVVAVDFADELLDELFRFAREKDLAILPMIASVEKMRPFLQPEVQFDMTLALALIHHLVFSYHMDVDAVLELLSAITKRVLVLEFVAHDSRGEKLVWENYSPNTHPKYNMPYVISRLKQRIGPVEIIAVGETRTLLVAMRE